MHRFSNTILLTTVGQKSLERELFEEATQLVNVEQVVTQKGVFRLNVSLCVYDSSHSLISKCTSSLAQPAIVVV